MNIKEVTSVIKQNNKQILEQWMQDQLKSLTHRKDLISDQELRAESKKFLILFVNAIEAGNFDSSNPQFQEIVQLLKNTSNRRASLGFTPTETATFIFSLKNSLLPTLREHYASDSNLMFENIEKINNLLDNLGLKTFEEYERGREKIILSQSSTLLELSSPIIKLWDNVLAVPIIGILDSQRTQIIMENLLEMIVNTGSKIALIDITGVSIVDTQVANHILKTVSAVNLLGAKSIITGIRPEVAQTIVNLGVELKEVITRATLADGLELAFKIMKYKIVSG